MPKEISSTAAIISETKSHTVETTPTAMLSSDNLVLQCEKTNKLLKCSFQIAEKTYSYTAFLNKANPDFIYVQNTQDRLSVDDIVTLPPGEEFDKKMALIDLRRQDKGYKFHISLDDSVRDGNFEKGWDIVKDILIKNEVYYFKIIKNASREKMLNNREQRGKEVTIYAFQEHRTSDQWQLIIQEVTHALAANNVRPSPKPPDDKAIPGTHYVSYRTDSPKKTPDPFEGIKITEPPHQPQNVTTVNTEADKIFTKKSSTRLGL